MWLKSIEFGTSLNGLSINVVRVIDKPDGLPGEPVEYVEFFIRNRSLSLNYHLTEDEIKMLIKTLEASVTK
jgi:hypothetical protein